MGAKYSKGKLFHRIAHTYLPFIREDWKQNPRREQKKNTEKVDVVEVCVQILVSWCVCRRHDTYTLKMKHHSKESGKQFQY